MLTVCGTAITDKIISTENAVTTILGGWGLKMGD